MFISTVNIFLLSGMLCLVMMLVLFSLLHCRIAGVKTWVAANLAGTAGFILYALGRQLPGPIAYELANGVYAAAMAMVVIGFRRFFGMPSWRGPLIGGVASLVAAIAFWHYLRDSFAMRTFAVALFHGACSAAVGITVWRARSAWDGRYPYYFVMVMSAVISMGHGTRALIHLAHQDEVTSLLQVSGWNLFFLSAGTAVLPVLTLGGVMMAHARIVSRADEHAKRDFLTGAWTRRALFEFVDLEMRRVRRSNRPLSLLLLDIDHFKSINDTLGHAVGDRVLVDMVLRAEAVLRNVDYFARIGGEEFAVLLPDADKAVALAVAERLRAAIGLHDDAAAITGLPPYTVSIGVAMLRSGEGFSSLMQRADMALYEAKAGGRNRVAGAASENAGASSEAVAHC